MSTQLQKIVSLLPSATEIVCALGLSDDLAGITHECDFPPGIDSKPHLTESKILREGMNSREIDHAVRSQLDGHGSIYSLDEELLRSISPDLIITQELCDVCAVNYEVVSEAARIHASDARVVSLEPTTIEEIFDNVLTVGELTGTEDKASELVSGLRARLAELDSRSSSFPTRPKVMMLEWIDPPFAPGHWVPEQVELAGGKCVLGTAGRRSVTTTYRAIAESQAEFLVFIPCGFGIDEILAHTAAFEFPVELQDLPAITEGNVWALDAGWYFSRPGPRVVDGAEILARILHPDALGPPDPTTAVRIGQESMNFAK